MNSIRIAIGGAVLFALLAGGPAQTGRRFSAAQAAEIPAGIPLPVTPRALPGRHGAQARYLATRQGTVLPAARAPRITGSLPGAQSQAQSLAVTGGRWTALGPAPITFSGYPFTTGSGRVLALAYSAAAKSIYLAAADGGVWKSLNGGVSWVALTDTMPSLAIGSLAVDPSDPTGNTVYAGTGELALAGDAFSGVGVYKTTSGGASWTRYGGNIFSGQSIANIVVDPKNPRYVFAAVENQRYSNPPAGVAISSDGGQTWIEPSAATDLHGNSVSSLIVDDQGNMYAGVTGSCDSGQTGANNGVYYASESDHGAVWTKVNNGLPGAAGDVIRLALDPATKALPQAQQRVYAVIGDGACSAGQPTASWGNLLGAYRTDAGGATWSQIAGTSSTSVFDGDQWWYDIEIAVDPNDPSGNTVWIGGTDWFKSTNAGGTAPIWTNVTGVYGANPAGIHPDQHAIVAVPAAAGATPKYRLYVGDDGGVYQTADEGKTFTEANGNLNLTQFYGGAVGTGLNTSALLLGGSQDNGTAQTTNTGHNWSAVQGSDGGDTIIDPTNNNTIYQEYSSAQVNISTDGGTTWNPTCPTGDCSAGDNAEFIAPLVEDPNNHSTVYSGQAHLWQTRNAGAATPWKNIGPNDLSQSISAVAVAPANSNTVYAGAADGEVEVTTNALSTAPTWTTRVPATCTTAPLNPACTGGSITGIAVDPTVSTTVYVSESGFQAGQQYHLFKSIDGGATWKDISTTLPNVPFESVTVAPTNGSLLFAGADQGVYTSTDGGANWSLLGTGLPNTAVFQLIATPVVGSITGVQLTAFTHGRGAWRTTVSAATPTAARAARFAVRRIAGALHFQWRMVSSQGVAGFNLFAGPHRLNPAMIAVHHALTYRYTAHGRVQRVPRMGYGPYTLHVYLDHGPPVVIGLR